ncbi:MAG: quinolinate synthase NadA [Verrucomicrobia bacterium]|nr:quinolinate synthase NadA [Verrucomicrobiota bacterium]MBU1856583.1 quinolinate synthase NadA [Verrucomicrobiota bacterium]
MNASESIEALRKQWGKKLFILGHYYQQDEVLQHADVTGDSLELSRRAAAEREAERIVFCGVHFMAESADILRGPHQAIYMPDIHAGCPMADMAPLREVQQVWKEIQAVTTGWVPVVYVNSSAAVKAFCGEHGGSTCTSSNAAKVFQWVFNQGKRILFIPDEHLGTNTARDLGMPDEAVAVYDPGKKWGGVGMEGIACARVLVWKGYCHVHTFTVDDITSARQRYPGARIIVHPETPASAARLADAHGSTSQIIRYVAAAPAGTTVVIGTELHLVDRLARQHRGRLTILPLRQSVCRNMILTTEAKLLALLEQWSEEQIVRVSEPLRLNARKALARMLEVK